MIDERDVLNEWYEHPFSNWQVIDNTSTNRKEIQKLLDEMNQQVIQ